MPWFPIALLGSMVVAIGVMGALWGPWLAILGFVAGPLTLLAVLYLVAYVRDLVDAERERRRKR